MLVLSSYIVDLLSLRLVGAGGAEVIMEGASSYVGCSM